MGKYRWRSANVGKHELTCVKIGKNARVKSGKHIKHEKTVENLGKHE